MKTADEELEANFYNDLGKITKEITIKLIKISPKLRFEYGRMLVGWGDYKIEVIVDREHEPAPPHVAGKHNIPLAIDTITLIHLFDTKRKDRWNVLIHSRYNNKKVEVNVSNRDTYTKKELEIAKNRILGIILDYVKNYKF